uniref:PEST proteolytic signal-containing nuclear protein n=1 Tax=Heliothis virescens TaxID=7102 RepID=A0A2A4J0B2_HELVI
MNQKDVPAPPPPPRITKISIGFNKPKAPIKMNIGGPAKPVAKPAIASVFSADDDDDEPEEMPAEVRMRMRNIGRETPTSAGPNSFGKTKQGFCDAKKVFEKNLKQALEMADKPAMPNCHKPSTRLRVLDIENIEGIYCIQFTVDSQFLINKTAQE